MRLGPGDGRGASAGETSACARERSRVPKRAAPKTSGARVECGEGRGERRPTSRFTTVREPRRDPRSHVIRATSEDQSKNSINNYICKPRGFFFRASRLSRLLPRLLPRLRRHIDAPYLPQPPFRVERVHQHAQRRPRADDLGDRATGNLHRLRGRRRRGERRRPRERRRRDTFFFSRLLRLLDRAHKGSRGARPPETTAGAPPWFESRSQQRPNSSQEAPSQNAR